MVYETGEAEDESNVKSIARNIISSVNIEASTTPDVNDLDTHALSALQPDGAIEDKSNQTPDIVDIIIGKKNTVTVNKVCHNQLGCAYMYASGIAKITALNLTVVRLRKQQRITGERKALTKYLFPQLHNEDVNGNDGPISKTIERLIDKNEHCIFDQFTSEVRSLMLIYHYI